MKAYTDLEQSEKLAEILPIESADMYYSLSEDKSTNMISFGKSQGFFDKTQVAWSLSALLSVLPYPHLEQNYKGKWCCRIEYTDTTYLWEADNPIDACYEMIIKLHEQNLL